MVIARVLLILMVLLHVVDFGCTVRYLTPDMELNPVAARVWEVGGYAGLIALKVLALAITIGAVELTGKLSIRLAVALAIVVVLMSCIPLVMFGLIWALP